MKAGGQRLTKGSEKDKWNQSMIDAIRADFINAGGSAEEFPEDKKFTQLATTDTGNSRLGAQQLSSGGTVYASKGQSINFQPRGTDTVPAMLTPGEFVVNRQSTQQNLPVLKAINSGTYSHGDIVRNLSRGGLSVPRYYLNGTNNGVPATGQGPSQGPSQAFDFTSFMNTFKDMLKTGLDTLKVYLPSRPVYLIVVKDQYLV